jgi:hypothetical protein
MTSMGHLRIAEAIRWARAEGWRRQYGGRTGKRTWSSPDGRITVHILGARVIAEQLMADRWSMILDVRVGCWQQALDALTVHSILPPTFNSAYDHDDGPAEWQWGVRTVHTDGSSGIEWSNMDDAKSFLVYYADSDHRPGMRIQSRELVRRRIAPRQIQVMPSWYGELRAVAESAHHGAGSA